MATPPGIPPDDDALQRARWQAMQADPGVIVMSVDRDLRVLALSRTVPGVEVADVIGRTLDQFVPPVELPRLRAAYDEVFAGGGPRDLLAQGFGSYGVITWWESRLLPVERDGRIIEVLVLTNEVTERVRAQTAIAESEARFRSLLDQASVGVVIMRERRVAFANPAYATLFGYGSPAELIGRSMFDLVAPEHHPAVEARERMRERGERVPAHYEAVCRRRDGTRFPVRVDAKVVGLPDGPSTLGFVVDISREAAAEAALRASESRFQAFMDASPFLAFIKDGAGRFVYANRAYREMFAIPWERLAGRTVFDLFPREVAERLTTKDNLVHQTQRLEESEELVPDYQGRSPRPMLVIKFPMGDQAQGFIGTVAIDRSAAKAAENALRESEARLKAVFDNVPFPMWVCDTGRRIVMQNSVSVRFLGDIGGKGPGAWGLPSDRVDQWQQQSERVLAGETIGYETESDQPDAPRVAYHIMAPVRNDGAIIGMVGVSLDLTERKRLESQLRQAQKMDAVGQLAGGIAHDFNNLLTAILGFTEVMVEQHPPGDPRRHPAEQVLRAAERAAALTSKLLAFSRKQVVSPKPLDLNAVVRDLSALLRRVIGEHIILELALAPRLPAVLIDQAQLEQVVMNLAVNARDAMPGGGRLILTTRQVEGAWVELEVSDSGGGLAPDVLAHLFEPFFTTKDHGTGTGLGLSTVYGIVSQAGGTVTPANRPGGGARFTVRLPRCGEPAVPAVHPDPPRAPGGRELILVVEDDAQVRELLRVVLTGQGYGVALAMDAHQAEALMDEGLRPQLLLTDLVMPGGDGRSLARRLAERQPGLRVVLMSGYAAETLGEGTVTDCDFLAKPFTTDGVLRLLRAVLDR